MLKLKLQYFGHLMQRTDLLGKTLMLGNIVSRRRRGQQRMRWLDGITYLMDMSLSNSGSWWWTGKLGVLQSMGLQRLRHDWGTELNWTEKILESPLDSKDIKPVNPLVQIGDFLMQRFRRQKANPHDLSQHMQPIYRRRRGAGNPLLFCFSERGKMGNT